MSSRCLKCHEEPASFVGECIILPLTGFGFAGAVEAVQKLP